jgi:hypothetical protein
MRDFRCRGAWESGKVGTWEGGGAGAACGRAGACYTPRKRQRAPTARAPELRATAPNVTLPPRVAAGTQGGRSDGDSALTRLCIDPEDFTAYLVRQIKVIVSYADYLGCLED